METTLYTEALHQWLSENADADVQTNDNNVWGTNVWGTNVWGNNVWGNDAWKSDAWDSEALS